MAAYSAVIVGGGIAGLSAAIALRRAGYGVTVLERAERIAPIGAALSLWPNAIAALRRLDAADRILADAAPITRMLVADRAGRPILGPHRVGGDSRLPTRSLLQTVLAECLDVPVRCGSPVASIDQDAARVTVTLANDGVLHADLAIVADGIWSTIAIRLLGNAPHWCGYGGHLALSDPLDDSATDAITAEYQGDGERFGLFDLGGGRRYWFHMRDESTPGEHNAATRDDILVRADGWPQGIGRAIVSTPPDRLIPFTIHARPAPCRLGVGRILCLGDAAHAMEPNLGQGACQALEDAAALAVIAARVTPDAILPAFEAARLARTRRVVRQSREGRYGTHAPRVVRVLVRTALRHAPQRLHERVIDTMHRPPEYR